MGLRKNNALKFLEDKTSDYAERVALGMKTSLGWNEFTYSGLGMLSRKLGHYLINGLELQKGVPDTVPCSLYQFILIAFRKWALRLFSFYRWKN